VETLLRFFTGLLRFLSYSYFLQYSLADIILFAFIETFLLILTVMCVVSSQAMAIYNGSFSFMCPSYLGHFWPRLHFSPLFSGKGQVYVGSLIFL